MDSTYEVFAVCRGCRRLLRSGPVVVEHHELRCVARGHQLNLLAVEPRIELHFVAARPKLLLVLHDLSRHRHLLRLCLLLEVVGRLPMELRNVLVWRWQALLLQRCRGHVVHLGASYAEIDVAGHMLNSGLGAHGSKVRHRRLVRADSPWTWYVAFLEQDVVSGSLPCNRMGSLAPHVVLGAGY